MNDKLIRELRSTEGNYMLFGGRRCGMSTLLRNVVANNPGAILVASGQPKPGTIMIQDLIGLPDTELLQVLVGKTLVMDVFMLENIVNHMSRLVFGAKNIIVGATGRPSLEELNLFFSQGFSVRKLPSILSEELVVGLGIDYDSREFEMDFGEST